MITLGGQTYALDDPAVMLALAGLLLALLVVILLILALRAAARSARMTEPLAQQMAYLSSRVQGLGDGQQQLSGGLTHVAEAQAASQAQMMRLMEQRLAHVTGQMTET